MKPEIGGVQLTVIIWQIFVGFRALFTPVVCGHIEYTCREARFRYVCESTRGMHSDVFLTGSSFGGGGLAHRAHIIATVSFADKHIAGRFISSLRA